MVEREPSVALLFDDAGLSAHLRDALVAQGARIVYESDLKAFAPAELVGSSADVVVVDLDEPSDSDLDRLYETVEGGHPRLVFNDADASRNLEGWDRARWARHLAAK
ncbi:MAG: chemotaxis protein CheB, partial [Luteibacter sp.]